MEIILHGVIGSRKEKWKREKCEFLLEIIITGVICAELLYVHELRIMWVRVSKKANFFYPNLITCGRLNRSGRWQLSKRIKKRKDWSTGLI